jgi:hypothetical protein
MCTVSWLRQPGGYHLFCNRDEKRTRGIALPPRVVERDGLRYIAPVDADSGGTWIAVNEHAVTLCLLNGGSLQAERSRGLVIPELIRARSVADCKLLFQNLNLEPFAPFTLLMIEPDGPGVAATWDGAGASIDPRVQAPLISSSYEPDAVRRERLREFDRHWPHNPEALLRFHASHNAPTGAHAPCMHRLDAETVSFSRVIVADGRIRFEYLPAAPCALAA